VKELTPKRSVVLLLSVCLILGAVHSTSVANAEEPPDAESIGFWKNNIRKAIENRTEGIQIEKDTLMGYLADISAFYLDDPFGNYTLSQAFKTLSSRSSDPVDLLNKHLLAAEFNYFHGAIIDVSLLEDAEDMANDPASYSREQILDMKDALEELSTDN
jgi:hypothetical protein